MMNMSSPPPAEVFDSLRRAVLDRLVAVRDTVDDAYAHLAPEAAESEFDAVLAQMHSYLVAGDPERLREFAARWAAAHVGRGRTARSLLHAAVALGDVIVQVAKTELSPSPDTDRFVLAVVRLNFTLSRQLVASLADELEHGRRVLHARGSG